MNSARRFSILLSAVCLLGSFGCKRPGGASSTSVRGDALFLAEAPALVPEELEPELEAMGIKRLYVPGATLAASGTITAVSPPPPNPIRRPVVFTVLAAPGAEALLGPGSNGALVGEAWGSAIGKLVSEARAWAEVAGVHLHLMPRAENVEPLAAALKAMKRSLGGKLPVSVTLPPHLPAATWKPLAGAADEALVFGYGRRPETQDEFARTITADDLRDFPLPFRVLVVPGGYGRGGADGSGRRIPDGEIDRLSEDHGLDFEFKGVLSAEPGTSVTFRPRAETDPGKTLLASDGGHAVFKYLTAVDLSQFLADMGHWASANVKGRVFLVDGVPRDGHLVGYPALRAMLTGKPWEPRLAVHVIPQRSSAGAVEFTLEVTNEGPTATDLSRMNTYLEVRATGGVITAVRTGDFDRFEILVPEGAEMHPAPFGRATVCRLFENIFVGDEKNSAGPIRVSGAHPQVLVGYRLQLPGGREITSAPAPAEVVPPTPTPVPVRKKKK